MRTISMARWIPLMLSGLTLMAATSGALAAEEEDLWEALAEGGKVVMLRHAQSAEASPDVSMHLSTGGDCSQEQDLSPEGQVQAERLGERLRAHGVTVDTVMSSEYCRARQTAQRAFGNYEAWDALNLVEGMPDSEAEWLMEDVRERIGDFAGEGDLILVSHRSNINTITFQQTEPGDMVVIEPDAFGGFTVLGTIVSD